MPNFQAIGQFAVEKSQEYENAIKMHSQLVHQKYELDNRIKEAELTEDRDSLESMYAEYRVLKADLNANDSFRQKFCEDFMLAIAQMAKETNNE